MDADQAGSDLSASIRVIRGEDRFQTFFSVSSS